MSLICLFALLAGCATPARLEEHLAFVEGAGPDGTDMQYLLAVPAGQAAPETGWPVLVFLHGRGEVGGDLSRVKIHGPLKAAASLNEFPFLVAAPHWMIDERWQPDGVHAVIDDIERQWPVDRDRIYLTGLSLGGHGTWATAVSRPGRFAAVAPISGFGDPQYACRLVHLPVWSFHGVTDTVVAAEKNQLMVDAVRDCGGNPGLTLYPDVGHDAWTRTYADPSFYEWLLRHARRDEHKN